MPGMFMLIVAFIKELIWGTRLNDPGYRANRSIHEWIRDVVVDKFLKSRPVALIIILMLIVSLSANWKTYRQEVSFTVFREADKKSKVEKVIPPKEVPTVPKPPKPNRSEHDDLCDRTVKELSDLYKEL